MRICIWLQKSHLPGSSDSKKNPQRISPFYAQSILVEASRQEYLFSAVLIEFFPNSKFTRFDEILNPLIAGNYIRGNFSLDLYIILIGLQAATGLFLFFCATLLFFRFRPLLSKLLNCVYFLLLISLTILTPLLFYFDQFSSIIPALVQFLLLLICIKYNRMIQE